MRRWWWVPPFDWSLPKKGSDVYGRHALVIPLYLFGTLVVPYKPCDCEDMDEFRCITPGCPWLSMGVEALCVRCDLDVEGY